MNRWKTTSWRVQVWQAVYCTHESRFASYEQAIDYFDNLEVPGVTTLQVRRAGKARFVKHLSKSRP